METKPLTSRRITILVPAFYKACLEKCDKYQWYKKHFYEQWSNLPSLPAALTAAEQHDEEKSEIIFTSINVQFAYQFAACCVANNWFWDNNWRENDPKMVYWWSKLCCRNSQNT